MVPAYDVDDGRGLWVYGVVPIGFPVPEDVTGLDGEQIRLVDAEGVAAVVSSVLIDRPPGRKAELLTFQSVLDRLAARGPIAPVRFGTILTDDDAARQFLEDRCDELERVLALLHGRRQYNLRARYVEDVVLEELVTVVPEIRELRDRTRDLPEDASYGDRVRLGELVVKELERRSADDAAMLIDYVYPHAAAHLDRSATSPSTVLDVALLVDETHGSELVGSLEELAEAVHERIRLELIGPMAPYDFAGAL